MLFRSPGFPPGAVRNRTEGQTRAVVVFGHTHAAYERMVRGVFYVNPGYAGRPKHGALRSLAILDWDPGQWPPQVRFQDLTT